MKDKITSKTTGYFQKIGKSLMLPVSVLPICAILMGFGYLLCPGSMNGSEISGGIEKIGFYMTTAGGAIINNMAVLFVIGVATGMSDDHHGAVCLAAFASWLVITTMLNPDTLSTLMPSVVDTPTKLTAFSNIKNPFIGILSGIIGAECYNHFKGTVLPDAFAFFSGKRFVPIVSVGVSLLISALLLLIWPVLFGAMVSFGNLIENLKGYGVGLYVFFNRLLIPSGLHHALNNVFWFDTIGIGDLTKYWAGLTSDDVSWSLGMYLSCFFPCFMGGIQGAALAMYHTAKDKKKAKSLLLPSALGAFICGVTEPFEFSFIFSAFPLFVVYSALCGIVAFITYLSGFRAGFAFSAGATDLLFSASLPAAQKTWLIIPLGIFAFVLFYAVFRIVIVKFDCKTPGREDDDVPFENQNTVKKDINSSVAGQAESLIASIGGMSNIVSIDCCATRLRLKLRDSSLVNKKLAADAGVFGVNILSSSDAQLIIGPKVQQVYDSMTQILGKAESSNKPDISCKSDIQKKDLPADNQHAYVHHGDIISMVSDKYNFDYTVRDSLGIHARPAGRIASALKKYNADIIFTLEDKSANAKSMSALLSLGAVKGSTLHISVSGAERVAAALELRKFLEDNL